MDSLINDIKQMIIDTLNLEDLSPDDIETDAALFGDGLGLDSIDALELGLAVKIATAWRCPLRVKPCAPTFSLLRRWLRSSTNSAAESGDNLMMNKEQIYQEVASLLTSLFEIAPEDIHPEARLYEDLELDSIDAVDMVVHLQKRTGRKIKPETFRAVRTVQDVVDAVEQLMREDA